MGNITRVSIIAGKLILYQEMIVSASTDSEFPSQAMFLLFPT